MERYRLEWPSRGSGDTPDRWSVEMGGVAARRAAARVVKRRRGAAWVRVITLGIDGDVGDVFLTAGTIDDWAVNAPPPSSGDAPPTAAPEIERLRVRALSAIDVVLAWARRRGVMSQTAADHVRLTFDAAMLGIVSQEAPRSQDDQRRSR